MPDEIDIEGRTVSEIVALVHSRLPSSEARRLFEMRRFGLSRAELVALAARTLHAAMTRR